MTQSTADYGRTRVRMISDRDAARALDSPQLVPVDQTPAVWRCKHCLQECVYTNDPTSAFKHLAHECPMLEDDAALLEFQALHRRTLQDTPAIRAIVAHKMKHPRDEDAQFEIINGRAFVCRPLLLPRSDGYAPRNPQATLHLVGVVETKPAPTAISPSGQRTSR